MRQLPHVFALAREKLDQVEKAHLDRYSEAISQFVYAGDVFDMRSVRTSDGEGEPCSLCGVPFMSGHMALMMWHGGTSRPVCYECVETEYAQHRPNPIEPPRFLNQFRDNGERSTAWKVEGEGR